MNADDRERLAKRLDAAVRLLRDVAHQITELADATDADRAYAKHLDTDIAGPLNASLSVFRLTKD
jgi:hypothetical protein